MSPQLSAAFSLIAETGRDLDDWWIIGSAALALHGFDTGEPGDVDLFATRDVIETFLGRFGETVRTPRPSERFMSFPYQPIVRPNMTDIEVMGDLKVENAGIWQAVSFTSRAAFDVPGGRVFAPDLSEQIELFRLFGRPKDLDKARLAEGLPR